MKLTWKRFVIVWVVTWLCTWLVMALAVLSYGVYRMRSTMNGIADKLAPFKFSISNENGTVKKIRRSDTVFYRCANGVLVDSFSGSIPIVHAMDRQALKQPREGIGSIGG